MSDFAKEIAEITERYKHEIDALKERYIKTLEELEKQKEFPIAQEILKKKIEATSLSYFS